MMEYTEIWQPLLLIFTCFVTGVLLGALLVYIRMKNDYDLLLIDLEFAEEKLQKQEELLCTFYDGYDDGYDAY